MLPDWDFGGDDAKRRAFIEWVWEELNRFAVMASGRVELPTDREDWTELLQPGGVRVLREVGRPAEAFIGMNAMVWEFGLLRYMFGRYWPGRKRRISDKASAASIAVARCQRALPPSQRGQANRVEARASLAQRVFEEWERGSRSPGRQQAEADIAYLDSLPTNRFAR